MDEKINEELNNHFNENILMKKIITKFYSEDSVEFDRIISSYVEEKIDEIN